MKNKKGKKKKEPQEPQREEDARSKKQEVKAEEPEPILHQFDTRGMAPEILAAWNRFPELHGKRAPEHLAQESSGGQSDVTMTVPPKSREHIEGIPGVRAPAQYARRQTWVYPTEQSIQHRLPESRRMPVRRTEEQRGSSLQDPVNPKDEYLSYPGDLDSVPPTVAEETLKAIKQGTKTRVSAYTSEDMRVVQGGMASVECKVLGCEVVDGKHAETCIMSGQGPSVLDRLVAPPVRAADGATEALRARREED